MCQSIQKPPSFTVTTEKATSAASAQWNRRVGRSQTRTGAVTAAPRLRNDGLLVFLLDGLHQVLALDAEVHGDRGRDEHGRVDAEQDPDGERQREVVQRRA